MKTPPRTLLNERRDIIPDSTKTRRAVGYVRVPTDMQATDGLSLDAQTAAIRTRCADEDE